MNLLQEKALYHLTGQMKNGELAGVSLEKIVSNYPYFGPAQSLLACHYHTIGHPSAAEQSARATIFHSNPRWWAFQLEEAIQSTGQPAPPVFTAIVNPESVAPEIPLIPQETDQPIPFTPPDEPLLTTSISIPTVEAVKEILRKIDGGIIASSHEIVQKPATTLSPPAEPAPERLTQLLQSQLSSFQQPVKPTDKLEYQQSEPLHTVDYFASQGIQLNLKQVPKDALTNKLMSFTDWLRKVKQSEKVSEVSPMEKKVSEDASNSVRKEEIVTEAMAEVLLRQGHREQAIQLFSKLSFQFPEKSSYFAARIEQIKAIL